MKGKGTSMMTNAEHKLLVSVAIALVRQADGWEADQFPILEALKEMKAERLSAGAPPTTSLPNSGQQPIMKGSQACEKLREVLNLE